MSLNENYDIASSIPLTSLKRFEISAVDVLTQNIWVGTRYSIDDDFFQDYDSINYCCDPRVVLFAKIHYPDGYVCYHDILNNVDAPINTSDMNNRIAKYQIYPYCPLSEYLRQGHEPNLSEEQIIELLPTDLKEHIIGEVQPNVIKQYCLKK